MNGLALSCLGGAWLVFSKMSDMACWAWLRKCMISVTRWYSRWCSRDSVSFSNVGSSVSIVVNRSQ